MIPKEFQNTLRLHKELKGIEDEEAKAIYKLENPTTAHFVDDEYIKSIKEAHEENEQEKYKKQITSSFKNEYLKANETNTYFLGCSFTNYEQNFDNRSLDFKTKFTDAKDHNFIYEELKAIIFFELPKYIDDELIKSINYSLERTKEFLIKKIEDLGFNVEFSINENGLETLSIKNSEKDLTIKKLDNSKLEWEGTETDLIELGKAIYEAKCINHNISQKEFFNLLMEFFNFNVPNPAKALQNIRKRKIDQTKLINRLEQKLTDWQSKYG